MHANQYTDLNIEELKINVRESYDLIVTSIVNPKSGLANDYLNVYNEVLLMIENLPIMPEIIDEIINWKSISYKTYFENSKLTESQIALGKYINLHQEIKKEFDGMISKIDETTQSVINQLKNNTKETLDYEQFCSFASRVLRVKIDEVTYFINNGQKKANS
jgi:hypothetical protein